MINRPSIPKEIERKVLIEAGHRCAICKYTRIEIAHIIPWAESSDNSFENLIALCPNCHDLYDKDKKIDKISMLTYKNNLAVLNQRYGDFERRILQHFFDNPNESQIVLWERDLDVLFLVKDGLLKPLDRKYANIINFPPKDYLLTEEGKALIDSWKKNHCLK